MNYYNNPPINLWDKNYLQQQNFQQLQPIQNARPPVNVACYTVSNKEEMSNIEPQLNVLYVGINRSAKEIYTKQLNNNGLVDSYVYTQFSNEKQETKDDFKTILNRLENIEHKLGGTNVNTTNTRTTSPVGTDAKQSNDSPVQPNDAGQEHIPTDANAYQPSQV